MLAGLSPLHFGCCHKPVYSASYVGATACPLIPRNDRIKTAIEPERELVEIGLKVLRANAVVATSEPAFQITEDQMGDGQKVLGHAGITLRRDRQMPIEPIRQSRKTTP